MSSLSLRHASGYDGANAMPTQLSHFQAIRHKQAGQLFFAFVVACAQLECSVRRSVTDGTNEGCVEARDETF